MADGLPVPSGLDLTPLTAPFTKLIETVSSGVGVLYEPRRIREKAKAEADAEVTHAKAAAEVARIELESSFELRDVAERAEQRVHSNEIRRQKNIEAIVSKAAQQLPASVSNEPVDEDWAVQFFQFCQDIGNEEMQKVWASLLAGEVTKPGSFSLRTLNLVRTLNQSDARLFKDVCNFLWSGVVVFTGGKVNEWFQSGRLLHDNFLHLGALGLMSLSVNYEIEPGESLTWRYDRTYVLRNLKKRYSVHLWGHLLTAVGKELRALCDIQFDQKYLELLLEDWKKSDIGVEPV